MSEENNVKDEVDTFRENKESSGTNPVQDISSILDSYVANTDFGKKLKKFSIFNHWEEIVGKEIGRKTKPEKIFKGILYISVSSPGWASELRMISEQVIEKINTFAGGDVISKLRFKIMQ